MNVLLDTCAILSLSVDHPCVKASTREMLKAAVKVYVSPISIAELACLQERNRIELPILWKSLFREAVEHNGWDILDITMEIAEEAYSLPDDFPPDPVDRILTASARKHNLLLLTSGRKILDYPHVTARW